MDVMRRGQEVSWCERWRQMIAVVTPNGNNRKENKKS